MLKNLLVAYNASTSADAALRAAMALAGAHRARLTAVMAHGLSDASRGMPGWMPEGVRASVRAALAHRGSDVRTRFEQLCTEAAPVSAPKWIEAEGEPGPTVGMMARYFDLVLVGQFERVMRGNELSLSPDAVVLLGGRPVLCVPADADPARAAAPRNVVVAWDGKRAAARALMDSLPLLRDAQMTTLLSVGEAGSDNLPAGVSASGYLDAHGIVAQVISEPHRGRRTYEAILAACTRLDADLLVMGAFEHPKPLEDLVGGVTRSMLESARLPVLMSH
ncbi:MAG: universal stress protein [Pararhodobacter sp.]|nr:universal stress protein [Pararhodobacter sp.]